MIKLHLTNEVLFDLTEVGLKIKPPPIIDRDAELRSCVNRDSGLGSHSLTHVNMVLNVHRNHKAYY